MKSKFSVKAKNSKFVVLKENGEPVILPRNDVPNMVAEFDSVDDANKYIGILEVLMKKKEYRSK
jgi:hypothetical protein